jgi:hypothetical protein
VITGGEVFVGRVRPTCFALDFSVVVPALFDAVTLKSSVAPSSRIVGVYVALLAPVMVVQLPDLHRCQR